MKGVGRQSDHIQANCYACFIAFGTTCEPCSSRISKWWLDWDMPLGIDLIKNERNSLNKKQVIHAFFYITIHVPSLQSLM
jgi:hypothetical protein